MKVDTLVNFLKRGWVEVGRARMSLVDIKGGFYTIRQSLREEIGDAEKEVVYNAGMEGAYSFLSSAFTGEVLRADESGFREGIDAYSLAGFGDFIIKELQWDVCWAVITCEDSFEGWAFREHSELQSDAVCDYTRGVLAGFMQGTHADATRDRSKIFCVERSCIGKGDSCCEYVVGIRERLMSEGFDIPEKRLSIKEHIRELNREILAKNRELDEINEDLQRRVEEAAGEIKNTKEHLENLIHSSADAILTTDVHGVFTFFSKGAEDIYGYKADELLGKRVSDYYANGMEEAKNIMRLLTEEGKLQNYETAIIAKDGRAVPSSVSASLLRDEQGEVVGVLGVIKDISELKRLEQRVKSHEQYLANIMTDSADAIIGLDADDKIRSWNRGAEQVFGYMQEEVLGKSFDMSVPDKLKESGELALIARQLKEKGFIRNYETERIAKGGTKIVISLTRTAIRDADGNIIGSSAVIKDITEKKLMERHLLQSEKLAVAGKISSKVAHEIRNPLGSISLNVELLQDEIRNPEAMDKREAEALLRSISSEVDRLKDITEEYLEFARLPKLRLEQEDVNKILMEILGFLDAEISRNNIAVEATLDESLPDVTVDRSQLRQAFLNILINSTEAMANSGKILLNSRELEDDIRITISDTGVGIEEEDMEFIFNPFFSTKDGGTGLGLSVTQQIIGEHGGGITCESSAGNGTTFVIRLPKRRE